MSRYSLMNKLVELECVSKSINPREIRGNMQLGI